MFPSCICLWMKLGRMWEHSSGGQNTWAEARCSWLQALVWRLRISRCCSDSDQMFVLWSGLWWGREDWAGWSWLHDWEGLTSLVIYILHLYPVSYSQTQRERNSRERTIKQWRLVPASLSDDCFLFSNNYHLNKHSSTNLCKTYFSTDFIIRQIGSNRYNFHLNYLKRKLNMSDWLSTHISHSSFKPILISWKLNHYSLNWNKQS